jgi:tetratricopeptide (TPR) repeat protein
VWQALRSELHPQGVEIVTVALDVDAGAPGEFIAAAHAEHPSLIDQAHVMDELFGVVNVPNGVWIDEDGVIVRPAEPAHPGRNDFTESFRTVDLSTLPPDIADVLREARKIRSDPEVYPAMLRDWAEHGAASRFALTPDEVVRRSRRRSPDAAMAAAHFELGQHLHAMGDHDGAIPHWRQAHRLDPENWTYKRNAWNFEDPVRQGHTDVYDGSWYEDIKKIGAENYYPPIEP